MNSVISYNTTIYFEIIEIFTLLLAILICVYTNNILNGIMCVISLIEYIKQIYYCYRFEGKGLLNIITLGIYLIFILYNIIKNNIIFILLWCIGLLIHLVSYFKGKPFSSIICLPKILK